MRRIHGRVCPLLEEDRRRRKEKSYIGDVTKTNEILKQQTNPCQKTDFSKCTTLINIHRRFSCCNIWVRVLEDGEVEITKWRGRWIHIYQTVKHNITSSAPASIASASASALSTSLENITSFKMPFEWSMWHLRNLISVSCFYSKYLDPFTVSSYIHILIWIAFVGCILLFVFW